MGVTDPVCLDATYIATDIHWHLTESPILLAILSNLD